jgi:hypothetical protein
MDDDTRTLLRRAAENPDDDDLIDELFRELHREGCRVRLPTRWVFDGHLDSPEGPDLTEEARHHIQYTLRSVVHAVKDGGRGAWRSAFNGLLVAWLAMGNLLEETGLIRPEQVDVLRSGKGVAFDGPVFLGNGIRSTAQVYFMFQLLDDAISTLSGMQQAPWDPQVKEAAPRIHNAVANLSVALGCKVGGE